MTTSSAIAGRLGRRLRPGTEVAGGFFRMCVLTGKALKKPFEWREFIWVGWFLMRVSLLPTIAVSIPETVLLIFTLNVLLPSSAPPTSPAPVPGSRRSPSSVRS